MCCRYCFARFQDVKAELPAGHLCQDDARQVTALLAERFDKITFVGGEPTLCPWLPELVRLSKSLGATTMLVSNGTRLTESLLDKLQGCLDWVGLSIDSINPETNIAIGRKRGVQTLSAKHYLDAAARIRERGVRLKLNTVVTALNAAEDLSGFVRELQPERWKMFQVLAVDGQNNGSVEPLLVSAEQFSSFVGRHIEALRDTSVAVVGESNTLMTGSYAMVDPAGRFFDNASGRHKYSSPLLKVGLDRAFAEVSFDHERFEARSGRYEWR